MNTSSGVAFRDRVAERADDLSPRERAVTDFLLNRPADAVTASAADLAAQTGTSDATVVRTARTLGYAGLRELKRALLDMLTSRRDPAIVLDQRLERLGSGGVLEEVLRDSTELTGELARTLDAAAWRTAVELLAAADRVWVYGIGPAAATAHYQAVELGRLGKRATAVGATGFRLADELLNLDERDAVLVHAPLRMFREIETVLSHAESVQAPVVVVTEALEPLLHDRARAVLLTPTSTTGAASENLAGWLLAHALTMELAARDRSGSVAARQRLNALRHEIAGTDLDTPVVPEPGRTPPESAR